MKRHWMHIIASTFCIFCLGLILMSIFWLLFIFDKITDYNYGNYTFRYDYSRDDAYFEYELIDHNIYNKNITKSDAKNYSLVKNYYKKNNNIFFHTLMVIIMMDIVIMNLSYILARLI